MKPCNGNIDFQRRYDPFLRHLTNYFCYTLYRLNFAIWHKEGWEGLLPSREAYSLEWGNQHLDNISYDGDVIDFKVM